MVKFQRLNAFILFLTVNSLVLSNQNIREIVAIQVEIIVLCCGD